MKIYIKNTDGTPFHTVVVPSQLDACRWCSHHATNDRSDTVNNRMAYFTTDKGLDVDCIIDIRKFHPNKKD